MNLLSAALEYRNAGLSVIPARANKAPGIKWELYQKRLPTDTEIQGWFENDEWKNLGLVCGTVSGGLEVLDFDLAGAMFADWKAFVDDEAPGLLDRLPQELSPSGGRHFFYRFIKPAGNTKLATKNIDGKPKCGIETRGEGGFIVCAPSPNYTLQSGLITTIPTISENERETLWAAARMLSEFAAPAAPEPALPPRQRAPGDVSPMEDFNARANVADLLSAAGWRDAGTRGQWHNFTRPGKPSGISGGIIGDGNDRCFFVFTSNAPPFEPSKGYSPFAVFAALHHHGDYSATAKALFRSGFGSRTKTTTQEPPPPSADDDYMPEPPADYLDDGPCPTSAPRNWTIEDATDILSAPPERPEELIKGVVFRGGKMYLSAPSKARKTFWQMSLAVHIAAGLPWFGHEVTRGKILYINFELNRWSFFNRLNAITNVLHVNLEPGFFSVLHLRGQKANIEEIEAFLLSTNFSVIIFDPLYKMLGTRNENAAGEMGDLFNRIEAIASRTNATVVVAHHFAKGNASEKAAIDRGSGSGVSARDGDALVILTPHESDDCFTMEMVLRDFPPQDQQVLRWRYPLFEVDGSLDPERLKQQNTAAIPITDGDIFECVPEAGASRETIIAAIMKLTGRGQNAAATSIRRALNDGLLHEVRTKRQEKRDLILLHKSLK